jgi:hypothetical protein
MAFTRLAGSRTLGLWEAMGGLGTIPMESCGDPVSAQLERDSYE